MQIVYAVDAVLATDGIFMACLYYLGRDVTKEILLRRYVGVYEHL